MASKHSPKTAELHKRPTSSGKVALQSILSDGRKSLATINDERILLQQNVLRGLQAINQVNTDYWTTQAKDCQETFGNLEGGQDDGEWHAGFATREILKVEAAAAKQKQLWSQIDRMVQDAKAHDDKFWASWQNSLRHLAAPGEPTQQSPSTPEAKTSVQQPRREARFTRATTKASTPQGPTALTATRAKSRLTKPTVPETPSALGKSPRPVRFLKSSASAHHPESSDSPSSPALASSPATTKTLRGTTCQETKARAPRTVTARLPIKPAASVTKPTSRKKRAPKPAKTRVNLHPVTDPKPGHLYQAYYHSTDGKERGWYMGTVLPWASGDWSKHMMMDFSMRDMDLDADWPDCCEPGYKTKTISVDGRPVETRELLCIKRWMPDFEDGGPRILDRKFLFLFFEDRPKRLGCLNIDPTEPMSLISFEKTGEPVPIDWVAATDLRNFDVDDGTLVRGELTAEKYRNKLDHVARLREQACIAHSGMTSQSGFGQPAGIINYLPPVEGSPPCRALDTASSVEAQLGKQEDGTRPAFLNNSPNGAQNGHSPSQKEQGKDYPATLSPGHTDIDEAYEEPQNYTKRTLGKRPFSNDFDEYDEGLGMDYDLNLRNKSATQMSRPQVSVMGLPHHKLPRLGDYNMPGPV